MSYVTLAFSQGTSGVLGKSTVVAGLLLDAATSEELNLDSDITEYEVEDGSDITDHIKNNPPVLTITGLIGDAPLAIIPSAADLMAGAISGIASAIGGSTWKSNLLKNPFGSSVAKSDVAGARSALNNAKRLPASGKSRLIQAIATLIAAREAKQAVVVVTGVNYYSDYYIKNIVFNRSNGGDGRFLSVSVTLQHIKIVSTQTGTLQYPKQETGKTATKSKSSKTGATKGKANQKATTPKVKEKVEAAIYLG
jgi:hypothetical protein